MVHRKKALALGLFLVTGVMQANSVKYKVQNYMNQLPALSSALLNAAYNGNLSGVQEAIKSGADIIARDYYHNTAIMIARDRGYGEIVTYLNQQALFSGANRGDMNMVRNAIMGGADKNARDYNGKTAAEIAFRKHYYGIVSLLSRPLLDAAYRGDLAGVKAALADGAYINALDNYNNTAIMIARDRGHAAVAEYLKDVALSVMGTPKNTTSEKKLLK